MGSNLSTTVEATNTTSTAYNAASARDYYALQKNGQPQSAASLSRPKVAKTNRILAFHSSQSWRGYLEASKAFNNLIVIAFAAAWYGPCRYMEPTLNEFAAKYTDVEFVKIDADELFEVSRLYGVQTMPTFVLIKKGKTVDKVVGARKEELQRKIEKHRIY